MKWIEGTLFALSLALPLSLSAQVRLSEIMYDVPGTDTGREWVEVFNDGSEAVDLSLWKFFEEGVNHSLTLVGGQGSILPGGYAVISDTPAKFLADWPNFSGLLYDSSFSLKNTGEILTLRDQSGADIYSVTFDPTVGGGGDGNSLHNSGTTWTAGAPSPGTEVSAGSPPAEESVAETATTSSSTPPTESAPATDSFPVEPQIFASAGKDRIVIAGADTVFVGQAVGVKKEPLVNARFLWNFGDGDTEEGERVLHHYDNPGSYAVILFVSSGKYSALSKIKVTAESARIFVSSVTPDFIEVTNGEGHELDISLWSLSSGGSLFMLPANTIILPHTSVRFSSSVTKLSGETASLLYPNGTAVTQKSSVGVATPPHAEVTQVREESVQFPAETHVRDSVPSVNTQSANVSSSFHLEGSSVLWWGALLGFLGLSVAGALFIRRQARDEIEIIEDIEE